MVDRGLYTGLSTMTGYFELLTRAMAARDRAPTMGRTWTHTRSAEAVLVRMLLSFQRPPRLRRRRDSPGTWPDAGAGLLARETDAPLYQDGSRQRRRSPLAHDPQATELAAPEAYDAPVDALYADVKIRERLVVDVHPAAGDQPPRL